MKKRELARKLGSYGWWDTGEGGKHEKWTNGSEFQPVPRGSDVNEITAKAIIKLAKNNPGK